jgi:3-dehydroquinate synthase
MSSQHLPASEDAVAEAEGGAYLQRFAVAIGIALDTRYSVMYGMLAAGAEDRVCFLLENLGFKLWHPALRMLDAERNPAILQGLREFREHLGGEFTVTLLTGLGEGIEVHELDEAVMMAAIDWLEARSKS